MDDISLKIETGKFNYRVAGLIINNDKLLVMKSPKVPYFYLPVGRVKFNETAQDAIMREIYEELKLRSLGHYGLIKLFFKKMLMEYAIMKYAFIFYLILVKIFVYYMKIISQQVKKIKFIILHGWALKR